MSRLVLLLAAREGSDTKLGMADGGEHDQNRLHDHLEQLPIVPFIVLTTLGESEHGTGTGDDSVGDELWSWTNSSSWLTRYRPRRHEINAAGR